MAIVFSKGGSFAEVATLQGLVDSCFKGADSCRRRFGGRCLKTIFLGGDGGVIKFFGGNEAQLYRENFIQTKKQNYSHHSMKSWLSHSSFGTKRTMMQSGFQER